MDFFTIVKLLSQYGPLLFEAAPQIKKWLDIGTPLLGELQKDKPELIPVLEKIGVGLFPKLTNAIHAVAAAADMLFKQAPQEDRGTAWIQTSLNTIQNAGLDVDGGYGKLTKAAVEKFQREHQPASGPVDGWAGPKTRAVIESELAKLAK